MTDYIDFLFEDKETGEEFFVELVAKPGMLARAYVIARAYFAEPHLEGMYDNEDAELLGFDTYTDD